VSAESKWAQLKLSGGLVLFPAAAAALEHFAEDAALGESDRQNLVSACEQVCGDALRRAGTDEGALELTIVQYPDRIEIGIAHPGVTGPAIGLDTFLGAASGSEDSTGVSLLSRVDRVKYETSGQVSRMILVKYLPGAKTRAN
jgi:hypothetical protein